jgi:hypothetical protein
MPIKLTTASAKAESIVMFSALASLLAIGSAYSAVKDCGAGLGLFRVDAVSLIPATPVSGQNVTLHLEYTVPDTVLITDGLATYSFTYNFIPFAPTTEPLCANVPCPLAGGHYSNDTVSMWPSGISGTVVSRMSWTDPLNALLLCIEISGKVR